MAGLYRNYPDSRQGKYPVLLRRDGTVPEWEHFVLGARDPAAITAIHHYADDAAALGWDPAYVADLRAMAESWRISQFEERRARIDGLRTDKKADPDGAPHRQDDPNVLTFPGSLAEFAARIRREERAAMEKEIDALLRALASTPATPPEAPK